MPLRYGPFTHRQLVLVREAIRVSGPHLRQYATEAELRALRKTLKDFLDILGGTKLEAGNDDPHAGVPAERADP